MQQGSQQLQQGPEGPQEPVHLPFGSSEDRALISGGAALSGDPGPVPLRIRSPEWSGPAASTALPHGTNRFLQLFLYRKYEIHIS